MNKLIILAIFITMLYTQLLAQDVNYSNRIVSKNIRNLKQSSDIINKVEPINSIDSIVTLTSRKTYKLISDSVKNISLNNKDLKIELVGLGHGHKDVVGLNFTQKMDFNLMVSFNFTVKKTSEDGDQIRFSVYNNGGEIRFWGKAEDYFNNITTIFEFDYRVNYDQGTGSGSLITSIKQSEVLILSYSLPTWPIADHFRPFKLEFSGLTDSLTVFIHNFDIWQFEEDYQIPASLTTENELAKIYFYNTYSHLMRLISKTPPDGGAPKAAKICADASQNASFIAFAGSPKDLSIFDIKFRIKEDSKGMNPKNFGAFGKQSVYSGRDSVVIEYYHPHIVKANSLYREIHLEAFSFSNQSFLLIEYPIHIYRAPLTFIHGLWSNSKAFLKLESDLVLKRKLWTKELTHRVNYKKTNDRSFKVNAPIIRNNIHKTIFDAISHDFSVGKTNVICHSMGGVLTRFWIQDPKFNDNICRFITLNTPHSGSQMANLLLEYPEDLGTPLSMLGRNTFNGAVYDLRVDSKATLADLNGKENLNKSIVPSHVVVTHATPGFATLWGYFLGILLEEKFLSAETVIAEIFNQDQNDIIVANSSQAGGFLKQIYASTTEGVWHIESTDNVLIMNNVLTLLEQDPEDVAFFSKDGFNPPVLKYNWKPVSYTVALPKTYDASKVKITSPLEGSNFTPGSQINVAVVSDGTITQLLFAAGNPLLNIHSEVKSTSNAVFNYTIPQEAASSINLVAIGYNDQGFVDMDSSYINVEINHELDSLTAYPTSVYMFVGDIMPISIEGHFDDAVSRNLSYNNDVTYEIIDPQVGEFIEPGIIKALRNDTTTAEIIFRTDTAKVIIYVLPDELLSGVDDHESYKVAQLPLNFTLMQNHPNPFNSNTVIQYSIPATADVQLIIYNLMGQKITTLVNKIQTANTYKIVWNGKDEYGNALTSGMYFYKLEVGHKYRKIRKMIYLK